MEIESVVANKTLLAWRFQLPEHHFGISNSNTHSSCLFFHRLRRLNKAELIILLL
jgi:hypothetical protein